ncbi:2-dehydro-3-deoxygluconokinase [Agrococcus baldri]|uniref:2-dehydro-3-deoxygluconokinase n=1 Tax=Agrococcus baldri TaxID=153730 RepID=A0AA94HLV9_9MICO|nr:sugar kinase [Agrococcus baldri]SFS09084.1 2-dehydro-3-deoxygluconokinase [Agrococcus baldri]
MPTLLPPADRDRVLCIGESMALVTPVTAEPLRTAEGFAIRVGGAESTVALYLADAGHRASWTSRLGDDPLGQRLLDEVEAHGVDVSSTVLVEGEPTGVYFKDPGGDGTAVHYYRSGSAASRMGPDLLDGLDLDDVAIIHVSGITAGLSVSCAALLEATFDVATQRGIFVSFDVNHRPGLWSAAKAAPVLGRFASRADLVFVGRDEAESLWGTGEAAPVARLLGLRGTLVVKDGPIGAIELDADGSQTFVPAHVVDVVEVVGAGDAFTAGYLGALLRGADAAGRLQEGHDIAARALSSTQDFVPRAAVPITVAMGS